MKISTCTVLIIGLIMAGIAGCKPGDNKIKTTINNKIKEQPGLAIVSASVSKGVVTLDGIVNTESEKKEATVIAGKTKGVKSVVNHINIRQSTAPTSDLIKDEILIEETDLILKNYPGVTETVSAGVITLSGSVSAEMKPILIDTIETLYPSDINDQLTVK